MFYVLMFWCNYILYQYSFCLVYLFEWYKCEKVS
jgi:hypothetical protein